MTVIDWAIVTLYLGAIIFGARILRPAQQNVSDYFLAGRSLRWWQSGLSTMATQLSAVSLVSAPAFVALKKNGGLKWLGYELAVPLGLLVVIALIMPAVRHSKHLSIYAYLETRFDAQTSHIVALLFLVGRGLATAVVVLAGALVISTALGISTTAAILIIGLITVLADTWGGIRIVVYSDIVQMGIIFIGMLICAIVASSWVGWDAVFSTLEPERRKILHFDDWGLHSESTYGFWPMLLGGLFLYASYYGCDQSQMQRELAVESLRGSQRSLLFNAFARFPLVLLYCVTGLFVGVLFTAPDFLTESATRLGMTNEQLRSVLASDPDRMLPFFILAYLPAGVRGLLVVAILSALMSSLDSAINSLSAVTMEHFVKAKSSKWSAAQALRVSHVLTFIWGIASLVLAMALLYSSDATRHTSIVVVNAIGSALYGPILATFIWGICSQRVSARGAKRGLILGVMSNVFLWQYSSLSWLWWNLSGFLVASVCMLVMRSTNSESQTASERCQASLPESFTYLLLGYTFLLIALCWIFERLLQG